MPFRCSWATVMNTRFTQYGSTFRRHFRLRLYGLEARILPAKGRVEGLPEVLRHAAEHGRDQLHLPPTAQGRDARKLGERDAWPPLCSPARRTCGSRAATSRPGSLHPPAPAPGRGSETGALAQVAQSLPKSSSLDLHGEPGNWPGARFINSLRIGVGFRMGDCES